MNNSIFDAAREVLRFKSHTTVAELARLTELKQLWILKVLNHNRGIVFRYRRTGRITRVEKNNIVGFGLDKLAYTRGLTFRETTGNYGQAKILETVNPKAEPLRVTQCWGGLGDSYTITVLNDDPVGVVPAKDFDYTIMPEYREWRGNFKPQNP